MNVGEVACREAVCHCLLKMLYCLLVCIRSACGDEIAGEIPVDRMNVAFVEYADDLDVLYLDIIPSLLFFFQFAYSFFLSSLGFGKSYLSFGFDFRLIGGSSRVSPRGLYRYMRVVEHLVVAISLEMVFPEFVIWLPSHRQSLNISFLMDHDGLWRLSPAYDRDLHIIQTEHGQRLIRCP